MPMSADFKARLFPVLPEIAAHFQTPFHIYDEAGIRETGRALKQAFAEIEDFREFFAVKALPNPRILALMSDMGFGFDCSSVPELVLSRNAGAVGEDIIFTSNNTTEADFKAAMADGGAILNLDDITLIEKLPVVPELICFRYNPGEQRSGNDIIGNPVEAKYGLTHEQIIEAYRLARERGARRFGLHTMIVSDERNHEYMITTAEMLLALAEEISARLPINFEFINIGGGFGIPYTPDDSPLDIQAMGRGIVSAFSEFSQKNGYMPRLYIESGRYMTGPHGALVTRVINHKNIYRKYVGVDASMAALMRPGMYGAYHEISIPGKKDQERQPVDVV